MSAHHEIALLSNGTYSVMVTANGAGYSMWRGLDISRWRADATRDCWGQFCYVRDAGTNHCWSIGRQPLGHEGTDYDRQLLADRAEFRRRDGDIETRWSVCVAPDVDAEIRTVTLSNHGHRAHELDLTSYSEVCLNHRRADQAHPAFAKLFLETEFDAGSSGLLARRRPRAANEQPLWAIHALLADESAIGAVDYETDRVRFLGRGRTPVNPAALDPESRLTKTTGPVLDPVFCLRRTVRIEPGKSARVAFVTGGADTKEAALGIAGQFWNFEAIDRAFADAKSRSDRELEESSLTQADVDQFNRLAAAVIFATQQLRDPDAVVANRKGQSGLWPYAISGDLPIVLARIAKQSDEALVEQLVRWRLHTRRRGLELDLVLLDQRSAESTESLRTELQSGPAGELLGKSGGVFLLSSETMPGEDTILLAAAARAVLGDGRGSLAQHLDKEAASSSSPPRLANKATLEETPSKPVKQPEGLQFWNGCGGFSADGHEYVIVVDGNSAGGAKLPPAPWTNVLANPDFGCLVTEAGLGYSWAGNSQMNRLTPWSNDPTSDPPGEAIYLRDEESGDVWTPTPLPRGARASARVRHGQGYTRYTNPSHGLEQELLVLVPPEDPLKLMCLTVRNIGTKPRQLSAIYFAEWVLGTVRENAPLQVVSEFDPESGAVLARNAWSGAFADKVAFAASIPSSKSVTSDRGEFLGRNGSVAAPEALNRVGLSGRVEAMSDPCAALMTDINLAPDETKEIIFLLGQAENRERVRDLIAAYASPGRSKAVLAAEQENWNHMLGAIRVKTPDPGIDLMLNRWLLYQVLVCRVWARSAFYQSGGAYGFRDQLQDVMALVYSSPEVAKTQILRSAARQFEEGDVQHWWHPPTGIGVRTRITDDLYFLPLIVHHYVTVTGDAQLLDEVVPFIHAAELREDQEEDFNLPAVSEQSASIFEHCLRALRRGYRLGEHGLPLMGTGDWNDGMNKVGAHGKGESVWNGWFFVTTLNSFAQLAEQRGDKKNAAWCRERAEELRSALEANAWDGAWYRRAYFDDGTPLGSAENDECQIDAIPQAWAVMSGVANPERLKSAMSAVQQRLVRIDDKLIQLFDPPFDKGKLQPGYIKGYVPGIRENGGQYTHAATWVVLATALQGDGDRAVKLWNLINPIHHATTPAQVEHYKVEPYVVCADVYGAPPHTGRGGWTWYTGSASWLYRVALEFILGVKVIGDSLRLEPCIPSTWTGFEIDFRYRSTTYRISVDNASGKGRGVRAMLLDGKRTTSDTVPLYDDRKPHQVRVELG
jgi:cellobiose phosphorylase